MARLPVLHKRKSKKQQALDTAKSVAKLMTTVKVASVGGRAAKRGAKAYVAFKGTKAVGRPVLKLAAVPVAVGSGVLVWRKTHRSNGQHEERPLGPVAHAETVSPPTSTAGGS